MSREKFITFLFICAVWFFINIGFLDWFQVSVDNIKTMAGQYEQIFDRYNGSLSESKKDIQDLRDEFNFLKDYILSHETPKIKK